jgi:hypothetical protein
VFFLPLTKSTKLERNFGLLERVGLSERCLILSLSDLLKFEEDGSFISEKFCSELLEAGIPSVAARNRALDGDIGGSCEAASTAERSDLRLLIFKCFIFEKNYLKKKRGEMNKLKYHELKKNTTINIDIKKSREGARAIHNRKKGRKIF